MYLWGEYMEIVDIRNGVMDATCACHVVMFVLTRGQTMRSGFSLDEFGVKTGVLGARSSNECVENFEPPHFSVLSLIFCFVCTNSVFQYRMLTTLISAQPTRIQEHA